MDPRSIEGVARLHAQCLPHSLITTLGDRYARSFYRYVARSAHEMLLVEEEDDRAVAVAVLSFEPATLSRRLLLRTRLLVSLVASLPRLATLALASTAGGGRPPGKQAPVPVGRPQLILIFTAESERGKGRATALIRELERRLRQRGVERYEVRTESDPANPALAFYSARGFDTDGVAVRFGTSFQVFSRSPGDERSHST